MSKGHTLRFRMMVLFCTLVGVLLAGSYLVFWALLVHQISAQLRQQMQETARPIIADIITEPNARDVDRLDIPGEYFELFGSSGELIQRSANLRAPINLNGFNPVVPKAAFTTGTLVTGETLYVALIPFGQPGQLRIFAVAIPTFGTNRAVDDFGRVALVVLPVSLLVAALISTLYVGRSLAPVTALTEHAALMAKRVTNREGFWTPLPVTSPHDELGRLAETFNRLLQGVDSAVCQLRQFVTDASHELRTPLSVLHGETELLLSRPRTSQEYLDTLLIFDDEIKKLTRIVEGLFTLSMADAGQLHLECEPLYIDEVLEEACALVGSRARSRGISIVREFKGEISYYGDEAFLHQLFLIFLDNAIKYSSDGTSVHVSLQEQDGTIRVRFRDQGIGIAKEHLPFIFERFYRATTARHSEAYSGGLGLAIAQAIARAQGGSIECESSPDVGSTFTIVLPLRGSPGAYAAGAPKQKLILS